MSTLKESLRRGDNKPRGGKLVFDSSAHIRYQGGVPVAPAVDTHRRIVIRGRSQGGYTVTIYNPEGPHPLWGNNIQMSDKQMEITGVSAGTISLRGFGRDALGGSFADYGLVLHLGSEGSLESIELILFDRDVTIHYL